MSPYASRWYLIFFLGLATVTATWCLNDGHKGVALFVVCMAILGLILRAHVLNFEAEEAFQQHIAESIEKDKEEWAKLSEKKVEPLPPAEPFEREFS